MSVLRFYNVPAIFSALFGDVYRFALLVGDLRSNFFSFHRFLRLFIYLDCALGIRLVRVSHFLLAMAKGGEGNTSFFGGLRYVLSDLLAWFRLNYGGLYGLVRGWFLFL